MPEERKLVTVLFADVTGSTALGEDLDPEDVRALMGRYYDHARRVVSEHGGTLEKFIGDAVMAVFGLPRAQGNDAERAVGAALALRTAVNQDTVLREQVTLRIGVNTGEVVATGDPSGGDFLVTGDAVNVAARLQQCANPGEILTSERTRAAARAAFLFGESREVEVKGKREALRVVPTEGIHAIRQVERPPLVGRKRELAQLSLLPSWALEEHQPQLISMVAPAGIGKTRLLEAFLASLDPDKGWQIATGRCLPYGQSLTYWPLRGLLEDLVGGIARERVVDAFVQGGLGAEDASRLADLVLAPLGIESEILPERESIFNAWRLLIETLARETPWIVVFEDLHWASDSLLDLVEHIMHPRTRAPLLIIVISRPELLDRRPAWGGGGRQNVTALALEPLSQVQTAQLVERLARDLPQGIQERIVERSGGNPFFATELVRGLEERGISGEIEGADIVPDTVHAAVLARLDALSPVERSVLQAASVAGRAFRPATLAAVVEALGPAQINTAIEGLVARDLAAPGEGGDYTFRHALIRDVAYGTLSRAERIRMHAAVATWLESYGVDRIDEFVELIAYHYLEAVMLSRRSTLPLPLPFDPTKAVSLLVRAGELAGQAGALAEARGHIESAIAIAPPEEHVSLLEKLGDCVVLGEAATDAYRNALERWRAAGAADELIGARLRRKLIMGDIRFNQRLSPSEIVDMLAEAQRLATEAADEDELWRMRVAGLWWLSVSGEVTPEKAEEARATSLAAGAHFEKRGDWQAFSEAMSGYGEIALSTGRHPDMIDVAKRLLSVRHLSPPERGEALAGIAYAYSFLGEYEGCIAAVREALTQIRPGESIIHLGHASAVAANAAWLGGHWSSIGDFLMAIEEGWDQFEADPSFFYMGWGYLAGLFVARARGDGAAARAAATRMERTFPVMDLIFSPAWRGMAAAYRDDDPTKLDLEPSDRRIPGELVLTLMFLSERGERAPRALISLAANQGRSSGIDPLARCVQVAEALAAGDPAALAQAIDEAKQHGLIPHAARMRIVLAQMTGDPAPLERARPVLERLEDRQFLRRLEEAAAILR